MFCELGISRVSPILINVKSPGPEVKKKYFRAEHEICPANKSQIHSC